MDLSQRLMSIIKLISNVETLADIGTDHGYIPIYAIKNYLCVKVIASDINKGPLAKAKSNIEKEGLYSSIELRLGAGLTVLKENEANAAVISGMGGDLTRDIIESNIDIFKSMEYIIVQPAQNVDVFRSYIFKKGFNILDENICIDDNKFYETIKLSYGTSPIVVSDIFFQISQSLYRKNDKILRLYILFLIDKYKDIYNRLTSKTENVINRKLEVQCKLNELSRLLENMNMKL